MAAIYPSLISADLLNLESEIKKLEPFVPGFHIDVMDGHFVPNLTWGSAFIDAISTATGKQLWVHLMVDNPLHWVEKLALPGGSLLTLHIETINKNLNIIKHIQEKNWKASIALNPKTNVDEIFPFLNIVDQALVMSVEPVASGQSFLKETISKIDTLVGYRQTSGFKFKIAMDGGISTTNIKELAHKGVDQFAIANSIFGSSDPVKAVQELNKLVE